MSKLNKKSINVWAHKHVKADGVKIFILFIPLVVILIKQIHNGSFEWKAFLDTSILMSFLIVFLCEMIADFVIKMIEAYTEDDTKTTTDYEGLVKRYCCDENDMIKRKVENSEEILQKENGEKKGNEKDKDKDVDKNEDKYMLYPILKLWQKENEEDTHFRFIPENARYQLPKQIADHSDALLKAHSQSTIYNNMTIRLDDFKHDGNKLELRYKFTTYFDTLITNRAMDYPFMGKRTIREIYEPGPFIQPLSQSKMSNHIGFNGFVKLSDDVIVFVQRGMKLSTAKGKWSPSISASLKTKHALDDYHELTIDGMNKAIREEIMDELKIPEEKLNAEKLSARKSVIGFYRDLVEGGKPHFVFYYECDKFESGEFAKNFQAKAKENEETDEKELIIDGKDFKYYSVEKLKNAIFDLDGITIDNQKLEMTPSAIASIVILLDYLNAKDEK